jgi:hypothetical protein
LTAIDFSALKLKYDEVLSGFALNLNLRRYISETTQQGRAVQVATI